MSSVTPVASSRRPAESDHRWLILVIVAIAQLMVVLDSTVVNIALPSAQRALAFPNSDRQWVVTAYALAFGSLLLVGGRLGDMFSRKRVFITGLAGFALSSALGGAATSFGMLVAARTLQGAFGAILAPAALGTLVSTFRDPRERGRAFGVFGSVAGGGGAVGLILGGVLTQYFSWRWTLYVNLIPAAIAAAGAVIYMRTNRPDTRPRMDPRLRYRQGLARSWVSTAGSPPATSTILVRLDVPATSVTALRRTPNALATEVSAASVALPSTARALTPTIRAPARSPPMAGCTEPGRTQIVIRTSPVCS